MGAPESSGRSSLVVGVISDTHGHLYSDVKELLRGVDHIVHAGDICSVSLLTELRGIAPVTAVRGNCDVGAWAEALPARAEVRLGGVRILVVHVGGRMGGRYRGIEAARQEPDSDAPHVVISGHSHQPMIEERDDVLFLNPGSAGPRRWGRPRTMAYLRITPAQESHGGADSAGQGGKGGEHCEDCAAHFSAEIVVLEG